MRLLRFGVVFGIISLGCQDPDYGGEKGALRLRFGLGGCTSVPAAKSALATGSTTELQVADTREKRTSLRVSSADTAVVSLGAEALALACTGDACEETQATLSLSALAAGRSRVVFTDEGGTEIDALTLSVADATSLRIEDGDGNSAASGTLEKPARLVAKLRGADGEVYARGPFTWTVEGEVLEPITSTDGVVNADASATGTSRVNVRFRDLSASIEVRVTD